MRKILIFLLALASISLTFDSHAMRASGRSIDSEDQFGRTPLWYAVRNGEIEHVNLLVNGGAMATGNIIELAKRKLRSNRRKYSQILCLLTGNDRATKEYKAYMRTVRERGKHFDGIACSLDLYFSPNASPRPIPRDAGNNHT